MCIITFSSMDCNYNGGRQPAFIIRHKAFLICEELHSSDMRIATHEPTLYKGMALVPDFPQVSWQGLY